MRGVMRLELRKTLFSRRAVPLYLMAGLPLVPVLIFIVVSTLVGPPREMAGPAGASLFFIGLFQMILRLVVFFTCVWVFMNLFRGEVLDRSLHFYLLSPIRREVLAAGKYVSGWIASSLALCASTATCFVIVFSYLGSAGPEPAFDGATLLLLARYLGVVTVACLAYGAVFLLVGLLLRSLILPALILFLLEQVNVFLPGFLKKISVIYYLNGMIPLPPSGGAVQILADPVSPWLAIPGIVVFTGLTLVVAGLRVRDLEIAYGED
jgi:hypothetical protein